MSSIIWMSLIQSVEGTLRTKRLTFPNKREFSSKLPSVFICTMKLSEVAQSCPPLCDPMDCSPPSSSIHGIHLYNKFSQISSLQIGTMPLILLSVQYAILRTESTPSVLLGLEHAKIANFELLSLHNHTSQFLIINLFT